MRTRYRLVPIGLWRSLEAHLLWEQGVVSSNLTSPTDTEPRLRLGFRRFDGDRSGRVGGVNHEIDRGGVSVENNPGPLPELDDLELGNQWSELLL